MGRYSDLDIRMKTYYENISKSKLLRRIPVAIRLDMRAGHTFTKGFKKPFDDILIKSMQDTMLYLCKNIQGCVFGYTQSDEITLILIDYQTLNTAAWFDYEVQKMCSISASMATLAFNKSFSDHVVKFLLGEQVMHKDYDGYNNILKNAISTGAQFDSRCFNIPKEEVANMIYWRQHDAIKNSIFMVAHYYFTTKELHGMSSSDKIQMLIDEYGIDWNNFPIEQQRGASCIKTENGWSIDHFMPVIKYEGRQYVEQYIYICE